MIQWICVILLYSLQYVPKDGSIYCRMNANRIMAFQLLEIIFRTFKPYGNQITYLLEEICMQTRPSQIERVYVS